MRRYLTDDVEPLLPAHLAHLAQQNQSARSITERRYTVLRAARDLGHPLVDVTRDELQEWRGSIQYLAPASQHNALVHVTMYLRWTVLAGHRAEDPTAVLVRPRNFRQRLPRPLSEDA